MKGLDKFPEEYFLKYKEKPIKIKPYRPKQKRIADIYINKLSDILKTFEPKIIVRGSTAFKIAGKGEVEVGVYPDDKCWNEVLETLTQNFGEPENLEKNYARFNDNYEEEIEEVEIIVLKGYEAVVDIELHKYLIAHPDLLKEYEDLKRKYCFSKRDYQRQKSAFLAKVIEQIPDEMF